MRHLTPQAAHAVLELMRRVALNTPPCLDERDRLDVGAHCRESWAALVGSLLAVAGEDRDDLQPHALAEAAQRRARGAA